MVVGALRSVALPGGSPGESPGGAQTLCGTPKSSGAQHERLSPIPHIGEPATANGNDTGSVFVL